MSHGSFTPQGPKLARSAFISRREGRYIFAIRTPACLRTVYRSGSIRIALGTADYTRASLRAARLASWMLRIKGMDEDPQQALRAPNIDNRRLKT
ncbi:DUF6538 domain-containing protein [Rhodopseudomonas sp.]|uniref:DUF6538 domain-containing protein n=1 Tax=Rhodopseudomonas sp. TaxID=1078 RepID=UPI003456EA48